MQIQQPQKQGHTLFLMGERNGGEGSPTLLHCSVTGSQCNCEDVCGFVWSKVMYVSLYK